MNSKERAEKIMLRINELACISENEDFISRTYGTAAFIQGRNKIKQWMSYSGLDIKIDNIGNIRARLASKKPNAKTLIIASHIDTIINAGKFDGPMGVLMGLDIIEYIKTTNTELPFHIELIGFCDEEGCRFHTTYLGSKAVAGSFDTGLLDTKDATGISLKEVIVQNGGNYHAIPNDAINKDNVLGYFEIHIEQGPVLYERNIPVGIVTAIAGQRRAGMVFNGEAGHAGTVPMDMRKDALACAAECINAIENFALDRSPDLVATVGKLHIINSASNVIPGEVITSLDIRSASEHTLASSYDAVKKMTEDICRRRNIVLEWSLIQETPPVVCDTGMSKLLKEAVKQNGYELVELVSGAGHDAVPMSAIAPVSMLFVRCYKGISHNPLEDVEMKDLMAAVEVSTKFVLSLGTQ